MAEKVANADRLIAKSAERQHGVVSIAQLHAAGLSDDAVLGRVRSGRLHRIHRGVYAVGHPGLSLHGQWMAAALTGKGAAVSHRSAAELWELLKPAGGPIDISIPGSSGRARRAGLHLHRRVALEIRAITRRHGIPVTKPAQTIADLRGNVSPKELRRAIRQANVLGLPIGPETGRDRTRSDLERDFLRICRKYRLPAPEVNVRVGHHLVDFLWRGSHLVVETDGYRYHRGRQAFRDDRARDLELRRRGFEVLHLDEEQLEDEPEKVAEVLRARIAHQPAT
ncbi:MAG TPA: type IV toxin-antitoxin system AbiEi family antitoxin domain-containing protein [Solirubrobacterales bacterium]